MKQSFYVYNNGDLKRKDNTLQFTNHDGEKRDIPVERISDIYVMSEMSFNTAFINYISQYGIPMHFFNYYNFYTGSYYPRETLLAGRLLVDRLNITRIMRKGLCWRGNLSRLRRIIFIVISDIIMEEGKMFLFI